MVRKGNKKSDETFQRRNDRFDGKLEAKSAGVGNLAKLIEDLQSNEMITMFLFLFFSGNEMGENFNANVLPRPRVGFKCMKKLWQMHEKSPPPEAFDDDEDSASLSPTALSRLHSSSASSPQLSPETASSKNPYRPQTEAITPPTTPFSSFTAPENICEPSSVEELMPADASGNHSLAVDHPVEVDLTSSTIDPQLEVDDALANLCRIYDIKGTVEAMNVDQPPTTSVFSLMNTHVTNLISNPFNAQQLDPTSSTSPSLGRCNIPVPSVQCSATVQPSLFDGSSLNLTVDTSTPNALNTNPGDDVDTLIISPPWVRNMETEAPPVESLSPSLAPLLMEMEDPSNRQHSPAFVDVNRCSPPPIPSLMMQDVQPIFPPLPPMPPPPASPLPPLPTSPAPPTPPLTPPPMQQAMPQPQHPPQLLNVPLGLVSLCSGIKSDCLQVHFVSSCSASVVGSTKTSFLPFAGRHCRSSMGYGHGGGEGGGRGGGGGPSAPTAIPTYDGVNTPPVYFCKNYPNAQKRQRLKEPCYFSTFQRHLLDLHHLGHMPSRSSDFVSINMFVRYPRVCDYCYIPIPDPLTRIIHFLQMHSDTLEKYCVLCHRLFNCLSTAPSYQHKKHHHQDLKFYHQFIYEAWNRLLTTVKKFMHNFCIATYLRDKYFPPAHRLLVCNLFQCSIFGDPMPEYPGDMVFTQGNPKPLLQIAQNSQFWRSLPDCCHPLHFFGSDKLGHCYPIPPPPLNPFKASHPLTAVDSSVGRRLTNDVYGKNISEGRLGIWKRFADEHRNQSENKEMSSPVKLQNQTRNGGQKKKKKKEGKEGKNRRAVMSLA